MGIEIAPAAADQAEAFLRASGRSFGFDVDDQDRISRFRQTTEWDRTRAAWDGGEIVGTSGAFSLDMSVPGATMACGGTTIVSVIPTHRRRGILRALIDAHLADVAEREEPIAALWASDSAIYGRFGYGCAALGVDVEVDREHSGFHRLAPDPTPVRLVDESEARDLLPPFYESVRRDTPGFFARSDRWWDLRRFVDDKQDRDGATAYRYAVTEVGGEVTGYVQYRYRAKWRENHGNGTVMIRELLGSDPGSWAGLWRFVLDHDLTAKIRADHRSPDDPLFELLSARRRASMDAFDSLWVRIMDPKVALEGRSYSAVADLVVEVHDPVDGSRSAWRLALAPDGSSVKRTTEPAEVAMDVEDLGACFMGWSRFGTLGRAGRIDGDVEHLAALDRAFAWDPAPWCPEIF